MQSRGIVLLHDETTTGTPDPAAGIWFGRFRKIPLFGILFKGHFAFRPDNRSEIRGKTLGLSGLPSSRVNARDNMAKPAEKKDPKRSANDEIEERGKQPSLEKLSKSRDEEARECGNEIV